MTFLPLMTSAVVAGSFFLGAGCSTPSRANIELRKQVQQLEHQNKELVRKHDDDQRVIEGLRDRVGTIPTLPTTRLANLFIAQGIQFGRLTGGADLDPQKPGDEGLAVYVYPTDQNGDKFKAAGAFDIWAFDLADSKNPAIGHWRFDVQQAMQAWNGTLFEYSYALICPWQKVPKHADLTVKVRFLDELTQTPFTAQRIIHVNLPTAH